MNGVGTERRRSHDRWLVCYADWMTLLFALFVLLYAGAWSTPARDPAGGDTDAAPTPAVEQAWRIGEIDARLQAALSPWLEQGRIRVTRRPLRLEIELEAGMLYASGSAELEPRARPLIEALADTLVPFDNAVLVEGFTDDRPIAGPRYPSNWELSAARATAVLRLLVERGVAPARLAAVAHGDQRPAVPNRDARARARNRRVVLVVLPSADPRRLPVEPVGVAAEESKGGWGRSPG
ncbi:MAG: flagellar motor protein MotD [Gammaproteobacteria bacterium]|nr:MAG: flagellar motor protein MotD [Gammaproteobacteria bacterium]